nr:4438_t:CDS:2 [Entrophospora candida]
MEANITKTHLNQLIPPINNNNVTTTINNSSNDEPPSPNIFARDMEWLLESRTLEVIDYLLAADALWLNYLIEHLQIYLIEHRKDWIKNNFTIIYQLIHSNPTTFKKLQNYSYQELYNSPQLIFDSPKFVTLDERLILLLLNDDNLVIDQLKLWKKLLEWGIHQNNNINHDAVGVISNNVNDKLKLDLSKDDFLALKKRLENLIPLIKFNKIRYEDFQNNVMPYKFLFQLEIYNDIENYYYHILKDVSSINSYEDDLSLNRSKLLHHSKLSLSKRNKKSLSITTNGTNIKPSSSNSSSLEISPNLLSSSSASSSSNKSLPIIRTNQNNNQNNNQSNNQNNNQNNAKTFTTLFNNSIQRFTKSDNVKLKSSKARIYQSAISISPPISVSSTVNFHNMKLISTSNTLDQSHPLSPSSIPYSPQSQQLSFNDSSSRPNPPQLPPFFSIDTISDWIDHRDLTTSHGFSDKKFHRRCDEVGPTVTFIKLKGVDGLIGGYNPLNWKSNRLRNFENCPDSFIFSLPSIIINNNDNSGGGGAVGDLFAGVMVVVAEVLVLVEVEELEFDSLRYTIYQRISCGDKRRDNELW